MRRIALVVLAIFVAGLLSGCADPGSSVRTVAPAEFSRVIGGTGTQVIDVRTPAEFATGHLPGAVNLDVEGSGFGAAVAALDEGGTYAVYCRSGNRSKAATKQMADAGIATIYELDGGINAWVAASLPVQQ